MRRIKADTRRLAFSYTFKHQVVIQYHSFQNLLTQVPEGEAMVADLKTQLKVILKPQSDPASPSDEALEKGLKLEVHALTDRISSLKAGLLTWIDHLERVARLQTDHDAEAGEVTALLNDIEKVVAETEERDAREDEQLAKKGQIPRQRAKGQGRMEELNERLQRCQVRTIELRVNC